MSDTLGALMDKLTITNIKLWFTMEDFKDSNSDEVKLAAMARHNVLNVLRNDLIKEIDLKINDLVSNGEPQKLYHVTKTYQNK
jgi:hypothetical protein